MPVDFNFQNVVTTEFGVGVNEERDQMLYAIPIDAGVQQALREMVNTTLETINRLDEGVAAFDPADKHAGEEYLQVQLDNDLASELRLVHQAVNLGFNNHLLEQPENIYCYFVKMSNGEGRHLSGIKRAGQFKGILKNRNRLLHFAADALRMVDDDIFKLDHDFDILIDDATVHILRPNSFVALGKLKEAILAAVPENIQAIQRDLRFVEFEKIQEYAASRARAAAYLASIRQQRIRDIPRAGLVRYCHENGVNVEVHGRNIHVPEEQIMDFLRVLDRRRYTVSLVPGQVERYEAASRKEV